MKAKEMQLIAEKKSMELDMTKDKLTIEQLEKELKLKSRQKVM